MCGLWEEFLKKSKPKGITSTHLSFTKATFEIDSPETLTPIEY